jgi:NAD-dependent DNA ligase
MCTNDPTLLANDAIAGRPTRSQTNVGVVGNVEKHTTDVSEGNKLGEDPLLPLKGFSIVFAGKIPSMTHDEAQQFALRMGAESISKEITLSTTLLVSGTRSGKKAGDAHLFGIKVITGAEFEKMCIGHQRLCNYLIECLSTN